MATVNRLFDFSLHAPVYRYWNKELERKKRGKPARLGLAIVMCVWWRLIVQGALSFCEVLSLNTCSACKFFQCNDY